MKACNGIMLSCFFLWHLATPIRSQQNLNIDNSQPLQEREGENEGPGKQDDVEQLLKGFLQSTTANAR